MKDTQELQRELIAMARCDAITDAHRFLIGQVIGRLSGSARGIEPEGRASEGPRAKPEEPGAAGTRPDESWLSAAAPAVEMKRPECFEFAMDFLGDPEAEKVRAYVEALESALTTHREHPAAQQERQTPVLAEDHKSMRVSYTGLLRQVVTACEHAGETAQAFMVQELQRNMQELGQRYYAGDVKAVDEFLQLYCVEKEARAALAAQAQKEMP